MDKLSYSLGVSVGANLKQQGFKPEIIDDFVAGLRDELESKPLQLEQEKINEYVHQYLKNVKTKSEQENQAAQKNYFAENLKNPDVKQTDSGLQYKIISEGKGDSPKPDSKVLVHYHGTFLDDKVFDSSVVRGQPITLPVNGVIQGWQEALQLMKPGDKWQLFVPSDLAYGARGAGDVIPPHTPLKFEVELLSIES
jgi:FKBP-type peptidyl-prolyl cis-trans isomerase FklB